MKSPECPRGHLMLIYPLHWLRTHWISHFINTSCSACCLSAHSHLVRAHLAVKDTVICPAHGFMPNDGDPLLYYIHCTVGASTKQVWPSWTVDACDTAEVHFTPHPRHRSKPRQGTVHKSHGHSPQKPGSPEIFTCRHTLFGQCFCRNWTTFLALPSLTPCWMTSHIHKERESTRTISLLSACLLWSARLQGANICLSVYAPSISCWRYNSISSEYILSLSIHSTDNNIHIYGGRLSCSTIAWYSSMEIPSTTKNFNTAYNEVNTGTLVALLHALPPPAPYIPLGSTHRHFTHRNHGYHSLLLKQVQ